MYKAHITLGVMPTRRGGFNLDLAYAEKEKFMPIIREIRPDVVDIVDIDDICEKGIIDSEVDSPAVVEKFKKAEVDAIFVPFCDFGEEGAVADVVSKFDVPILIWGPRDANPNKPEKRGRDCQCGIFAATKVIRRYGKTYSYIFNVTADTDEFKNGYETFIRVANVVKDFKGLRIAKIGERPAPFRSVMTNEARLMQKFGIQVVAIPPLMIKSAIDKALEAGGEDFDKDVADISCRFDCTAAGEEGVKKLAAAKKAVREILDSKGCTVGAIECWPTVAMLGIPACEIIGEVTDLGYPIACETDINGAISMAILRAANLGDEAEFLADLTIRNPENDNSELLWHCGPFPYSLKAEDCKASIDGHNENFEMKQGDLTLVRFDDAEDDYYLFCGEAKTTTGPSTTGTYVYAEVDDWKKWEAKFMFGPYIHHLGGAYGKYAKVMKEAARYLGLKLDTPDTPGPECL